MVFPVFAIWFKRWVMFIGAQMGWAVAWAAAVVAALALAGCSTTGAARLAYNQAPELAYWLLDDYVDFSGAQSLQVKAALRGLHDWHRQTQLPLYAQSLQGLRAQAASDISADQACRTAMEVRTRVAVVLDQIEPAAAQLAATLQPAQLDTLARKFAKGNAEWRSDFVDVPLQKAQARRFKQARERFEMLYGTLNEAQSDALKRAMAQSVFDPAPAYAERLRRQQDTLQTLKTIMSTAGASADSSATAGAAIRALMARTLVPSDGAYRRYQDALTTEGCVVFAELHQRATAAQRSHAAQTLQRYELLLLSLAGAP